MSLPPHISKGLVGELLTRPTNLCMNPVAKLLSPSKCDYVVSKGLWANLSCHRHPPGKRPNPADTRLFLTEKLSAPMFSVPYITGQHVWGDACPISTNAIWHLWHSSFFKHFIILCHVSSTPTSRPAPAHTCLRLNNVCTFYSILHRASVLIWL